MYMDKEISQEDFEAFIEYIIKNHIESMMTIDKSNDNGAKKGAGNRLVNQIKKGMPMTTAVNFPEASKMNDKCQTAYAST